MVYMGNVWRLLGRGFPEAKNAGIFFVFQDLLIKSDGKYAAETCVTIYSGVPYISKHEFGDTE